MILKPKKIGIGNLIIILKVHLEIIFIKNHEKIQKQINDLLTQIKNDGLFKNERIISSQQDLILHLITNLF